jgi:hypothetical protein
MPVTPSIEKLVDTLNTLSEDQIGEVQDFVDFLKAKTRGERTKRRSRNIVKLEGLWKNVPFDITEDDVREARHELGQKIALRTRKAV